MATKKIKIETPEQARNKELARRKRNADARARNQILRDLCGTSARAAKEDMGL